MARPPIKLTEEIQLRICEAIRIGASLKQAAQYGGISKQTLRRWIRRGKNEKQGEFRRFWCQVKKAEACLVVTLLGVICKAADEDWQAAVWWLEHVCPETYGVSVRRSKKGIKLKESQPIFPEKVLTRDEQSC